MINIHRNKLNEAPIPKIDFYDSVFRIPLNIKFYDYKTSPNVITIDNLHEGSFVEFRFNMDSKSLFEITVLTINSEVVEYIENFNLIFENECFNDFKVSSSDFNGERNQLETKILRSSDSVCFVYGKDDGLVYYKSSENLYIGLDSTSKLKSFYLKGLDDNSLFKIFGF